MMLASGATSSASGSRSRKSIFSSLAACARGGASPFRSHSVRRFCPAARRPGTRRLEAPAPIFPCPSDDDGHQIDPAGEFDLAAMQRRHCAEHVSTHLIFGILAQEDRTRNELLQAAADHGGAMALHQDHRMSPERASERPSSGFTTKRLVSPNSSCWSQKGVSSPIDAPRWKTGTIGFSAMQNGNTAAA